MNKATKEAQLPLCQEPHLQSAASVEPPIPKGWKSASGWKQIEVHKGLPCMVRFHDAYKHAFIGDAVSTDLQRDGFFVRLDSGGTVIATHFSSVLFEKAKKPAGADLG